MRRIKDERSGVVTSTRAWVDLGFGNWRLRIRPAESAGRPNRVLGSERMTNACGNSRHSVATSMPRHGASLQEVAALLRHQSITTTEIYARSM